jgi:hypothetical protein
MNKLYFIIALIFTSIVCQADHIDMIVFDPAAQKQPSISKKFFKEIREVAAANTKSSCIKIGPEVYNNKTNSFRQHIEKLYGYSPSVVLVTNSCHQTFYVAY